MCVPCRRPWLSFHIAATKTANLLHGPCLHGLPELAGTLSSVQEELLESQQDTEERVACLQEDVSGTRAAQEDMLGTLRHLKALLEDQEVRQKEDSGGSTYYAPGERAHSAACGGLASETGQPPNFQAV